MHARDVFLYLNLVPRDAKLVLERGWGQRATAGWEDVLSTGFLMIYAPREEEEEMEAVKRITEASIQFMLGDEAWWVSIGACLNDE